jgi:hypothetical protein
MQVAISTADGLIRVSASLRATPGKFSTVTKALAGLRPC